MNTTIDLSSILFDCYTLSNVMILCFYEKLTIIQTQNDRKIIEFIVEDEGHMIPHAQIQKHSNIDTTCWCNTTQIHLSENFHLF